MPLKLYECKDEGLPVKEIKTSLLAETTLVAGPCEHRKIAKFLEPAGGNMEKMGSGFSHEHLSDRLKEYKDSLHFVVVRPEAVG